MLLDLIYFLYLAVTAAQGLKRALSFPVVAGCRVCSGVSSPICLC